MIRLIVLFIFLMPMTLTHAQSPLSLENFIERAKESDPELQSIVADRLQAKYLMDLNLPSRRYLLSVRNEYGFTRDDGSTTILGATLEKPILESGTTLSIGKTITERPDREEDLLQFRMEQSLYRNAFGSQVRELKDNLELQTSVLELQVAEAYEDYLQNLILQYLDLTLAYQNYQVAQRLRKESETLLSNVKERRSRNIASLTDVQRAELQTALRKENELTSKTNLEVLSGTLARSMGDEAGSLYIPEFNESFEPRLEGIDSTIEDFLVRSRSRRIYDKQELAADASVKIAKENLKPEANLLLGFNIDKSTRFGTSINREEAVVGLSVNIPIDDSLTKAQIKRASYQLLKSKLAKKSFDLAIRRSLFTIRNQILRQKEQLSIAKKKRDLASRIVKDETRRYKVGKIRLEDLVLDKNAEAQYEFDYVAQFVALNKLVVQWLALTDQLAEKL